MLTRVLVALGSNVGDRAGFVRQAVSRLERFSEGPVRQSSIYRTDPQDMEDDAEEFANAAVSFETRLSAHELLAEMQQIEVELGRPHNHGYHDSRTIDLDIIAFGEAQIDSPELVVPHPRAHERRFVLMPLAEIEPGARLGEKTVRQLLVDLLRRGGS